MAAVLFYSALFLALFLFPAALVFALLSFVEHERWFWGKVETLADPFANRVSRMPFLTTLRARSPSVVKFIVRRFDPRDPWGLTATISVAAVLLGTRLLLGVIHEIVGKDPLVTLDLRLHNSVPLVRSPDVTSFMLALTELGGPLFLWPLSIGISLVAFAQKRRRLAATLLLAVAGASLLSAGIKLAVGHPRPADALIAEAEKSFPSGHLLGSAVVYGVLASAIMASQMRRVVRALCVAVLLALVAAVGLSRLYLGVHWPSDLLGSLAIALSCLACLLFILHYPGPLPAFDVIDPGARARFARPLGIGLIVCAGVTAVFLFGHAKLLPIRPPEGAEGITREEILQKLPAHLPARSEDLVGGEMEPISLAFVGTGDDLREIFHAAGWTLADLPTPVRVVREALSIARNGIDLSGPATPAYFADRPQTLTFEKPDSEVPGIRHRHHTRVWQTAYYLEPSGEPLWVATASFDAGIEVSHLLHLPTHRIDPAIDVERDLIVSELTMAGAIRLGTIKVLEPLTGTNAAGDAFRTDGRAAVLRVSLPVTQTSQ
jgi:membrane-associated phospholipid phosphatase